MVFDPATDPTPTEIGSFIVHLKDMTTGGGADGDEPYQAAVFELQVLDQFGQVIQTYNGDLVPHLTQQQIDGLIGFMSDLRAQASLQILGV